MSATPDEEKFNIFYSVLSLGLVLSIKNTGSSHTAVSTTHVKLETKLLALSVE